MTDRDSHRGARERAKRILDVGLAATLLVGLSPLIAMVALGIGLSLGAPVLFRQRRAGRNAIPFTIIKFRTMEMWDARCCQLGGRCIGLQFPPGVEMTRLAAFLRRTGLDELPQLFNILRGEMSFVGPRPLLERYTDRYTENQRRRLEVMPGITGWAQVNGRTDLSWEERLELDVWYVDHWSNRLDFAILWRTLHTSAAGTGFSQSGAETGLEFLGTAVPAGTCPVTGLALGSTLISSHQD
jgi:sugar transferase EpsL